MPQTAVVDCWEHGPDCALIIHATDDNHLLWVSHAPAETHVECRLGDQTPHAVDRRPDYDGKKRPWESMCDKCAGHFEVTPEERGQADEVAREVGLLT